MSSFLWCDHCLMLSKIQGHVAQFVLMSLPSLCVCVCARSVRCALLPVRTRGHVCVCAIAGKNHGRPCSTPVIRGKLRLRLAQQDARCACVSVHTLHPSQLPHMSTPHHIPGATAAITVTKEPANSFITQSTRALMTP